MHRYRELAPPSALRALVACLWTADDAARRVLPDACVDVVLTGGRLEVAGPATGPHLAAATPGAGRVGLRLRVGAAGAALGVPAGALRDGRVPVAELWGPGAARRIEDRVRRDPTPAGLLAAVAPRLHDGDPVARSAVVALAAGRPVDVGLGERQLRRRVERAVGYGPATLVRVLRFQRFLSLAEADGGPSTLARLAADAGYADQAHLARECRRLSGLPPSVLLASGAGAAGERSDWFKAAPRPLVMLGA